MKTFIKGKLKKSDAQATLTNIHRVDEILQNIISEPKLKYYSKYGHTYVLGL